jgi:hypothetical protein
LELAIDWQLCPRNIIKLNCARQLVLKALAERGGLQATLSSGLMPYILGQSSGDELDRAMGAHHPATLTVTMSVASG